jgi:hypothetical protein
MNLHNAESETARAWHILSPHFLRLKFRRLYPQADPASACPEYAWQLAFPRRLSFDSQLLSPLGIVPHYPS